MDAAGVVHTSGKLTGNLPFKYYSLVLSNCQGDWVENFDTEIDPTQYTAILVNGRLILQNPTGMDQMNPLIASVDRYIRYADGTVNGGIQPSWILHLDYVGSAPDANASWAIDMIVIDNSQCNVLPPVVYDMRNGDGSFKTTGDAVTPPVGLN